MTFFGSTANDAAFSAWTADIATSETRGRVEGVLNLSMFLAQIVSMVAAEHRSRWLDGLVGTRQTVLIENSEKGHADNFAPALVSGSKRGDMGTASITGRNGDLLIGIFE